MEVQGNLVQIDGEGNRWEDGEMQSLGSLP